MIVRPKEQQIEYSKNLKEKYDTVCVHQKRNVTKKIITAPSHRVYSVVLQQRNWCIFLCKQFERCLNDHEKSRILLLRIMIDYSFCQSLIKLVRTNCQVCVILGY